nr:hypothetical protein [Candidatus Mcinerneyibacteriales bacterium]
PEVGQRGAVHELEAQGVLMEGIDLVHRPGDHLRKAGVLVGQGLIARNGKVIAVATKGNKKIKELVDDVLYVPFTVQALTPVINTIPLQLLAYFTAVERGCDVDQPRNLAKSVTVE